MSTIESAQPDIGNQTSEEREEEVFNALVAYFDGDTTDPPDLTGLTQEQLDSIEGNLLFYKAMRENQAASAEHPGEHSQAA